MDSFTQKFGCGHFFGVLRAATFVGERQRERDRERERSERGRKFSGFVSASNELLNKSTIIPFTVRYPHYKMKA